MQNKLITQSEAVSFPFENPLKNPDDDNYDDQDSS